MSLLITALQTLHEFNRWLMLFAGAWAFAHTLYSLAGKRPFTVTHLRSLTLFTATLHLQVLLGVLVFIGLRTQHLPVFENNVSVQWGHILGGVLAAVSASLATVLSRKISGHQGKHRAAVLWSGLALLLVGKMLIALTLIGFFLLIQLLSGQRQEQRTPSK